MLVAVSTGGASAGLAKHLRLRLEALLPQSLGALAKALEGAREAIRRRYPEADTRRRALDTALGEGGALDPFETSDPMAVDDWLKDASHEADGEVLDFTLMSDDPEDLSLRQARALGRADTVLHDPDLPEPILIRARADAVRIALPADPPTEGLTVILRRA